MMKPKKGIDKKRILAIDDAAIVLKRITDALEEYYDVVTVNTGSRALRYLETEKPDLILLDIRMMPKDGFETLQEIRAMEGRADIPVIMLTGVEDKNAVMESIKLGICDYILKPFFPDDLLERIRQVLEPGEETPTLLDKAEES
ncbi:response regulator [Pseudoflavonifractor sp. 60]|uniref:response regulator n=1 Tax=Pseudoflavonifractor sp. 60 TaxID=2304576 RepID=UPI00136E7E06|nr:response regulator [Pseudoflavonifractor sp. 60]NBI65650.1 response regulator [Pseudoflavonifractor sp. 60]